MKVLLYGKNSDTIRGLLDSAKIKLVVGNPDAVLSYGGDGTLLAAEREFPQIPKLPIRDSKTCIKCPLHKTEYVLTQFTSNKLKLSKVRKLSAEFKKRKFSALNDIVIRNTTPIHAVRFSVLRNKKELQKDVFVGDGLVFSTTFGSSGYFKSITGKSFNQGFGLAFNNLVSNFKTIYFSEKDNFEVEIVRGPAVLSVDNNPKLLSLKEGDKIKIRAANENASIYQPEALRCPNCLMFKQRRLS